MGSQGSEKMFVRMFVEMRGETGRRQREKIPGDAASKRRRRFDPEKKTIDANTDSPQAQPSGASMKERMSESRSCTMIPAPAS